MTNEEIRPHHCFARAQRLLAEVGLVRDELGRLPDARPAVTVEDGQPRDCYFEALGTYHTIGRLAAELGVTGHFEHATPPLTKIAPGHVLQVIDSVLARVEAIKQRLNISEKSAEPALETTRTPSDVLSTLISINRQASRGLERPFAPRDCYDVVSLASAYATQLGGKASLAPFERKRKPSDCYARLTACHQIVAEKIAKRGHTVMKVRETPTDTLPGDVYALACLVLGDLTFLHALSEAPAPHPFSNSGASAAAGHRLPAHVDQLARTLEAQLSAIA